MLAGRAARALGREIVDVKKQHTPAGDLLAV
jgi:hypothetical protein